MSRQEGLPDGLEAGLSAHQDVAPPAWVLDDLRVAIRSTPQRRPLRVDAGWALAAAILVTIAGVGGSLLTPPPVPPSGGSPSGLPDGPSQVGSPPSGWSPIAPGPLSARHGAYSVWTGREVLILGGDGAMPPCPGECLWDPRILSDGAAYDPRSDSWRRIRSAPVPLGSVSGAVVDDELYLIASSSLEDEDNAVFLRYRIDADVWEELPPPDRASAALALVATDSRVIAYQGSQESGAMPVQAYDLASGTWSPLADDPLTPSYDRSLLWTGQDLVLIGIRLDPNRPPNRPSTYSAAILEAGATQWRNLDDSEISGWDPSWYWSGGQIVNPAIGRADGGETNNWGRFYPFGGMLTPGSWIWSPLPGPPVGVGAYRGLTVGGPEHVIASDGWVLHVPTGRWAELTKPRALPSIGESAIWAGDRLLVWGGLRWEPRTGRLTDPVGTMLDSGTVWVP